MSPSAAKPGEPAGVLHVDADSEVVDRLAEALDRRAGSYEVAWESDPADALARLDGTGPDCVVTEHDLPGTDGLAFLEAIRERRPDLPVVLFTGAGSEAVASRAIAAGVTDYVPKGALPGGIDSLAERVDHAIDGRTGQGDHAIDGRAGPTRTAARYDNKQLQQFLQAFPDAVFVMDEDGRYLDVIAGGDQSLLYDDVETLLGQRYHDVLPADTADRFLDTVRRALATGEQQRIEYQLDVKRGRRWFEARVGPLDTQSATRTVFWIARDITERKRREQEYEQIFDNVNDIIAVRDPETGEMVDANQAYADLLGYDREEMRGMDIEDVGVPEDGYDKKRGMEHLRASLSSDDPVEFEWKVQDADGRSHLMDVRATAAVINGEHRYLAIGRDVTDRKRREQAIGTLQDATERLQGATTPEEVAAIAVETASDVLGHPMAVCWFHDEPSDRLQPAASTDAVSDAGTPSAFSPGSDEYDAFVRGDVALYGSEEHSHAPGDAGPNPIQTGVLLPIPDHGLIAVGSEPHHERSVDETVLDVAKALADHVTTALERVERDQAVRESERRFRLIADRIDEVIYLAELDLSEVLYVNPAYETIWGRSVGDLYGDAREFIEAIDPRDRADFEADFEEMIAEIAAGEAEDRYEFEYRIRQPDGELRWVNGNGYAVEFPGGNRRFVGIVEDITERKRREQRLEVFNRILRHNLRNQLDVIRSHAEVLADRTDGDHARRIATAVDELAAIGAEARETDRIMSMDGTATELSLSETLREVIDATEPARHDVAIRTQLPADSTVTTNRAAVEIAVESALENAIEYADSTVTVAVGNRGDECVVRIADDGPGIPDEELVPIETGTETHLRHGRGLGLWRLRWSVDRLNGQLSFDTTDGTTVRITIPDREPTR